MTTVRRIVGAEVGNHTVSIETYAYDGRIVITINGLDLSLSGSERSTWNR